MQRQNFSFGKERLRIPINQVLPVRAITGRGKVCARYPVILASIREVGMIEPLMVYPQKGSEGYYLVVDGHLRLSACRELGHVDVECLLANEDESYTYNARINRVAPIQEREMILKAVADGVSVDRIAAALNVRVTLIHARISLTEGITGEVIELLKEKQMSPECFRLLRRVVPGRQIEIAELMVTANNYTKGYVEALLLGTPQAKFIASAKRRKRAKPEEIARMAREMESLEKEYKLCEGEFAASVLQLTVFRRYVIRLLGNPRINKFLESRHTDLHAELAVIAKSETVC